MLVAAAALLSFLAIRRNLYEGYGSVLDDSFLADVGAWAPTVALVVGLVLLWRRTGVGAEWIIGAGASFVLLNYGGLVDFLRREDTSLDTTAMVMRTIAAALTVVAVVIAWRLAEVPGPRINLVMGVVLVVAAIVALTGIRDYGDHVDLKVRSWLIIALIVLLLVRGLAFAPRTTGAPALVAGGLVGALAGLESGAREQWDTGVRSSLILATIGFAVAAVIGCSAGASRARRPPRLEHRPASRAAVTAAAPPRVPRMASRREQIVMTPAEVDAFLGVPRTLNVATIGPSGHPHLVAMWYGFLDGKVAFWTFAKSQKILNLRRSPLLSALAEEGMTYATLKGVELVGQGRLVDQDRGADPGHRAERGRAPQRSGRGERRGPALPGGPGGQAAGRGHRGRQGGRLGS